MLRYFEPIHTTEYVYSLDKLRLAFDMKNNMELFMEYMQKACDFDTRFDVNYTQTFSNFRYRHFWNIYIEEDDVSFAIGMTLNGKKDEKTKGWIEFNPNKCMNSSPFVEFLYRFNSYTVSREIVRYDLAIDIPLSRGLCKLVKTSKRQYKYIDADGITEELGKHNTVGFSKLYDKSKESNLNYSLTRFEITLDRDTRPEKVWPKIVIADYQQTIDFASKELSPKDSVFVELLKDCDNFGFYYNQLDYRTRKKFEPYVLSSYELNIDHKAAAGIFELARSFELIRMVW